MSQSPLEWLLYLRKSVGRSGISRQRTVTAAHLAQSGGTVAGGDEYADTDRTAYSAPGQAPPERPGYRRMLAELERRPAAGLAAWHADRIARNVEDCEELIRLAARRGGLIIETARGGTYDLGAANGRKRFRGDVVDAAYEVDHNIERMSAQKAEQAAEGRWLGGKRPFGWRPLGEGVLALDEAEAVLVKRGTADILAGATLGAVARDWRASGVPCALGGNWDGRAVRRVLVRARNAGLVEHRGRVTAVPGGAKWPAIVEAGDWQAVRSILADPARRHGPGPEPRHLLTGIALCGTCGVPVTCKRDSRGKERYVCSRKLRMLGPWPGPHPARIAADTDAYVAYLTVTGLKRRDAARLLRPDRRDERLALLAKREAAGAKKRKDWELYQDGVIDDLELADARRKTREDIADADARLAQLDADDAVAPFLADPERAWDAATVGQRRALVSGLMYVTVLPVGAGRSAAGYFDPAGIDVRWRRRLPSDG